MISYRLIDPPKSFSLADCATEPDSERDKDAIAKDLAALREELEDLQARLYASQKGAVLLILQGLDTSGKDGTIRRVFDTVNPLGLDIHAFKRPTPEELARDFLWRAHCRVPARGFMGIFNRSYYEAVIGDYVEGIINAEERERRFGHIRDFEDMLRENGTTVVKCMLHISKAEQKDRLIERLQDPSKHWKFSKFDLLTRSRWEEYQAAYAAAIRATSPKHSPWLVVPANKKWYRDYVVTEALVKALRAMAPEYPPLAEPICAEDIPD